MTDPKPFEWIAAKRYRFSLVTFCDGYYRDATEADLAAALADRPDVVRAVAVAAALCVVPPDDALLVESRRYRAERDALQARVAELETDIAIYREQHGLGKGDPLVGPDARVAQVEAECRAQISVLETALAREKKLGDMADWLREENSKARDKAVERAERLELERDSARERIAEYVAISEKQAELLAQGRKDRRAAIEAQKREVQHVRQLRNEKQVTESCLTEAMRVVSAVRDWRHMRLYRSDREELICLIDVIDIFDAREKDSVEKDSPGNSQAHGAHASHADVPGGGETTGARSSRPSAAINAGSVDEGTGITPEAAHTPEKYRQMIARVREATTCGSLWRRMPELAPELYAALADLIGENS